MKKTLALTVVALVAIAVPVGRGQNVSSGQVAVEPLAAGARSGARARHEDHGAVHARQRRRRDDQAARLDVRGPGLSERASRSCATPTSRSATWKATWPTSRLRRTAARHDGQQGGGRGPQGDGVRHDEPRQQPHLRLRPRGDDLRRSSSSTAAGIVHAGTGKNLEDARAPAVPRYAQGPHRASSACTRPTAIRAAPARERQEGTSAGAPGLNPLRYTTYLQREPGAARRASRTFARALYTPPPGTTNATRLRDQRAGRSRAALRRLVQGGNTPGTKTFEMNQARPDAGSCGASATASTCRTS